MASEVVTTMVATNASLSSESKEPSPKKNCIYGLVNRLRPIVLLVGSLELAVGVILSIVMPFVSNKLDKMYDTEDSKIVSLTSFAGLIALTISGTVLITSILLNKRKLLWRYVLFAMCLCFYIFVTAVMKIHFAILVLEKDITKLIRTENRHFLTSTACLIGMVTLIGSVIHFVGNAAVSVYYNLKYVQSITFKSIPS